MGCKTCELRCAIERDSVSKTLAGAVKENPLPMARVQVQGATASPFPLQCRHCQDATCLKSCPSGAMKRDAETDTVYVDQNQCRGCWMCVMSCPFGGVNPSGSFRVALKCDACVHMEEPACVAACPTGALVYGDDSAYRSVLAKKRGKVALFVGEIQPVSGQLTGLDVIRKDVAQ